MRTRLLVIDTETGGFDPDRHALLSIAAVDSQDGEAYTAIICPHSDWIIEPEALAVNGFTRDFLEKNGRPEREVIQDFALWLHSRRFALLAGCNVAFDRDFLRAAFRRCGLTFPMGRAIDLQSVAWLAWETGAIDLPTGKDGLPRLSLETIAGSLEHYRKSEIHCALEDSLLTLTCLGKLTNRVEMAPR